MSLDPADQSLSDSDIQQITEEIVGGRARTVWFTTETIGMQAGRSGKVIAMAAPDEIDFCGCGPPVPPIHWRSRPLN
ncbi:hypothetical protein [Nocardia vaccinii]|uniref:hypothetical protein n=1 Tax=Nocardia vaccinii TaxID=1822 RepID=UPI000AB79319|nr:hypothetical protein [Nocardia vaccinii]